MADKKELTAEQKEQQYIFNKIEEEAKRQGLNPDFALAVALRESGLKNVPASDPNSTAFGPFQVNKATAEANGVKYEDMIKDRDLAIRTGINNLVRHAKNPAFENDPGRIADAHHNGENSLFAKSNDPYHLSKEDAEYIADIGEAMPGGEFPQTIYSPPKGSEAPKSSAAASPGSLGSGTWKPSEPDLGNMPMAAQSAITGLGGAAIGASLGLAPKVTVPIQILKDYLSKGKLPPIDTSIEPTLTEPPAPTTSAWPGKQTPATVKPIITPITPETITAEMEKQVQPRSRVEKAIHGLASGEEAEGPGRERSTGFAETTGQMAARKREQARTGSQLNLNTDRPLAEFPDVAPAPGGYSIVPKTVANELADQAKIRADLATKQAQADAVQRIQATNAVRQSGMKAASIAGSQWQDIWQKMTEHAQNLANSPNEAERAVANSFLAKAKDVWSKGLPINQSLVAQGATLLGSVGASIPEAWKQHQEKNDVGAAQTLGTGLGVGAALASVPAKVLPGLSAVGQGVEAVQRGQQGDVPGAIVSGLGSLASVAPYAAPAVAGALGTAALPVAAVTAATAPFVNALRDRIKANQAATPSQYFQPPTQEELTQASQPAIVYPKP
jgi:hypothetical protein